MNDIRTNTLIIGCGIAGATAALRLSDDPNQHITVITRAPDAVQSNTGWSQGGIVTRGLDDSLDLLVKDILHAGAGLSSPRAARILAEEGPRLVDDVLIDRCGVKFDRDESDELVYGLEAAHSTRRIVHVGDKTGNAIIIQLLATLAERPNVTLLTEHTAVDLITFPHHSLDPLDAYEPMTCHGAYVLDRQRKEIVRVLAAQTILATGGLGQLYRNTSNPKGARGDGLAMAWRAGARIVNAEYVQFHPTTLSVRGAPNLLISEAVRGEGAALLDPDGKPFMQRYDPVWKELAPRDVVARAIHMEMLEHGYEHVYLDIASKRDAGYIRERFPQLIETTAPYRHRPDQRADPGRASGALLLRRRAGRRLGTDGHRRTLRRRRSELHWAARRESPRQHQLAWRAWSGVTALRATSKPSRATRSASTACRSGSISVTTTPIRRCSKAT